MSTRFSVFNRGVRSTPSHRIYFRDSSQQIISPWYDIPLRAARDIRGNVFNMVVEIPRWTNAKMEICKNQPFNPILQDTKAGKLRFVNNVFPYHGYIWNYGALPQTYEDPGVVDSDCGAKGDDDPLDVIDIGSKQHECGEVVEVKAIGSLALIDDGEMDWKVIAIDISDPLAHSINSIDDLQREMPQLIEHTVRWFKVYKSSAGGKLNDFAYGGKVQDLSKTLHVIEDAHIAWKRLVEGKVKSMKTICLQSARSVTCPKKREELIESEDEHSVNNLSHITSE